MIGQIFSLLLWEDPKETGKGHVANRTGEAPHIVANPPIKLYFRKGTPVYVDICAPGL